MAVAVDASSPARASGAAGNTSPVTSAAFTAPANALLVCCLTCDGSTSDATGSNEALITATPTDSGGLTWTKQVERRWGEATDGAMSGVWTARTTSSASRTVSVTRQTATNALIRRTSFKVYVLTGADVDGTPLDTVGANNEGGSTTNQISTTSLTPGADGLLLCADTDWNASGVFTSSNLTIDTANFATEISVVSGYRTCSAGVGVTGDLNAGGTAACQHKWCQVIVRQAGGAAPQPLVPRPLLQAVKRAGFF